MSFAIPVVAVSLAGGQPLKHLHLAWRHAPSLQPRRSSGVGGQTGGASSNACGGTEIAFFPKPEGTKAEHTALRFRVGNIADAIGLLKSRGVTFADYDFSGMKMIGHVCVLGSNKAAWFEDTGGNTLCLHEEIA